MNNAFRHCTGCGRGYDQKSWQRESFCGSCGWPLKTLPGNKSGHINPRVAVPLQHPGGGPFGLNQIVAHIAVFAGTHPVVFGTGAIVSGAGLLMLSPVLAVFGHGVMVTGTVLAVLGILGGFAEGGKDAGRFILAGLVIIAGGAGIMLIGNMIVVAGILLLLTGSGIAAKAAVETAVRRRMEDQLRHESINERVALSRQLEH